MLTKRIIPCLDVMNGKTVKGMNFVNLKEVGDPVELGKQYSDQGADELVYLDITASHENRKTFYQLVNKIAKQINIPFTVGGGIGSVDDISKLLNAGADKISINSTAIKNPNIISESAKEFGNQCIVIAIDAKLEHNIWNIYMHGGRIKTKLELFTWAEQVQELGAGEILFTSMNHDGSKNGFAIKALKKLNSLLSIPVIASGGAGTKEHFKEAFLSGKADAALAASIFHYKQISINELKIYLQTNNIPIRI
jgi:imidazole glycerol-phosphate synthase subunit HisF